MDTQRGEPDVRGQVTSRAARTATDEAPSGIYGTIVCASVMAAGAQYPVGEVAGAVIVTVLVYWAAERWSELLGGKLNGEPIDWVHTKSVLAAGWPMVEASYLPLVIMGAAWLLGAADETAISIALWTTIGVLGLLGAIAARRSGLATWGIVRSAALTALLGVVLVAVKALLH